MFNTEKDWQKEIQCAYLKAREKNTSEISGLYDVVSRIADKYFDTEEIAEGAETFVPLTNGSRIYFTFYYNSTAVDVENISNAKKRKPLINKEDSAAVIDTKLKAWDLSMENSNTYIGEKYPKSLQTLLSNITAGEIISFVDGASYSCLNNDNKGHLDLTKVFDGNLSQFTLENLSKKQHVLLNINDPDELQRFYNKNRKYLTERVEYSYSHIDEATKKIEQIEDQLTPDKLKQLTLGNITLIAKKSRISDQTVWYDSHGDKIDRETVALVLGLLNNHLRERTYKYNENNDHNLVISHLAEKHIEELCANQEYDKMFQYITTQIMTNGSGMSVNFQHFTNKPETFDQIPEAISFIKENNQVKCYALTFEDNDFNKDVKQAKEINASEFVKKCEQLYSQNCHILKTRTEEEIVEQYQQLKNAINPTQQKIIDNAVQATINNTPNKTPYKLENIDVEVKALLASFINKSQQKELETGKIKRTIIDNGEIGL